MNQIHYIGTLDRDPEVIRQRRLLILEVLAESERAMTRRQIQGRVIGDAYGADAISRHLLDMLDLKWVAKADYPRGPVGWWITDLGRTQINARAFDNVSPLHPSLQPKDAG
jgi:repressor of nif and glnA expression